MVDKDEIRLKYPSLGFLPDPHYFKHCNNNFDNFEFFQPSPCSNVRALINLGLNIYFHHKHEVCFVQKLQFSSKAFKSQIGLTPFSSI